MNWVRYANSGATRNLPLSERMYGALDFLPELGVTMEVFSGGQPEKGTSDRRVGSTRHDHGHAADVFFYKDGRRLDWSNPEDLPLFEEIVRRGRANGLTGFGAGDGYMQPGSMHIGFGNEAVWGAGGKGASAPDWLRSAYYGADAPTRETLSTNSPAVATAGLAITPSLIPGMDQEAPQMQDEEPISLFGQLFGLSGEREDQFRANINGLVHRPNAGLQRTLEARMGERAQGRERQEQAAQAQQQANRTLQVLKQMGASDQDLALAAQSPEYMNAMLSQMTKSRLAGPAKPQWAWNSDLGVYVDENDPNNTMQVEGVSGSGIDVEGETGLRKEFTGRADVKSFKTQADAFARIRAAAEQPDAAGDLALIFNYMKLLDPGSTVREGEFATAQNAAGVEGRVVSLYNSLLNGERLNPDQRSQFVNRAGRIYESARGQYGQTQGQFRDIATDYGLDPDRSVPDVSYQSPYAPGSSNVRPSSRNPQAADAAAILGLARRAKTELSEMDQQMFADLVRRQVPVSTLQDFLETRGR